MNSASRTLIRKAGVIAAGTGTRLRSTANVLKPLAQVAGRPLIDWVLESLSETGVTDVTIIINTESTAVRDAVEAKPWGFRIRWIVESTPSSMHSFLRVVNSLTADGSEGPFLISTVDTIATPGAFNHFAGEALALKDDSMIVLAITPARDDEKPLLVQWDRVEHRIRGFAPDSNGTQYATAGLYFVRAAIKQEGEEAERAGVHRLRAFLARLVERGYSIGAVPLDGSIDVDRAEDLLAAEDFVKRIPA